MAKIRRLPKQVEPPPPVYELLLTEEEAAELRMLTGSVSTDSCPVLTDIWTALTEAGAKKLPGVSYSSKLPGAAIHRQVG